MDDMIADQLSLRVTWVGWWPKDASRLECKQLGPLQTFFMTKRQYPEKPKCSDTMNTTSFSRPCLVDRL